MSLFIGLFRLMCVQIPLGGEKTFFYVNLSFDKRNRSFT